MVLGLGETGFSVVRYLHDRHSAVVASDSRLGRQTSKVPHLLALREEYPDVPIVPPRQFARALSEASRVVASPGVALDDSLIRFAQIRHVPVVGDIDLFMEEVEVPVVGITGTNGKTTTTTLVGHMLQSKGFRTCGNVGLPALDALNEESAGYVVELSSFQLERLRNAGFDVAAILNIAEDHLDHHRSMSDYVASKQRIYENCKFAVYNGLDPATKPLDVEESVAVNRDPDWMVDDDGIVIDGKRIGAGSIGLQGKQNHYDLVVAAAIASRLGASRETILDVVASFKGLPHRLQLIATIDGVEYINDSKATNAAASIAALRGLASNDRGLILIAGGDGKDADFQELGGVIDECVRYAVLIGRDAPQIADQIKRTDYEFAPSMLAAVSSAKRLASEGDKVLLSPACASYDMFRNFEHRGASFVQAVQGMSE